MAVKVTVVDGSTFTGLYGPGPSINVRVLTAPTTPVGIYAACGAYNVVMGSGNGLYHPSGAYWATDLGGGVYSFGPYTTYGTASGSSGAAVFVLPTPPFSSTNLLAWYDSVKTYSDSSGVAQPSTTTDSVGYNTISSMEDLSGNGFGILQGDKSLQPLKGAAGAPVTDIAAHTLFAPKKSLTNSKSKLTVCMRVKPRSDLAVTGTARTLLYISRSTNTTLIRTAITLTGSTTGRRVFADYGVADSATAGNSRTTTNASGPQLTNDVFNSLIVEFDLSISPCTASFYVGSTTAAYVDNGLTPVTGSAPFAFGSSNSLNITLGDTSTGTRPALCEIDRIAVFSDIGNAAFRQSLLDYMGAP